MTRWIPARSPTSRPTNAVHGGLCCLGERANSLPKTTYKVLRPYRGCPWRLSAIVAAALMLPYHETGRTA